jgi:hypothetical protein
MRQAPGATACCASSSTDGPVHPSTLDMAAAHAITIATRATRPTSLDDTASFVEAGPTSLHETASFVEAGV